MKFIRDLLFLASFVFLKYVRATLPLLLMITILYFDWAREWFASIYPLLVFALAIWRSVLSHNQLTSWFTKSEDEPPVRAYKRVRCSTALVFSISLGAAVCILGLLLPTHKMARSFSVERIHQQERNTDPDD